MKKFIITGIIVVLICIFFAVGLNHVWPWSIKSQVSVTVTENTSLESVIENTIGSVVHITNNTMGWQGSGVAITPCLVLTARHVIEGGEDFTITLNNGEIVRATRAISSKKYDLGFIWVDDLTCKAAINEHDDSFYGTFFGFNHLAKLKPAKLGSISECRLGQQIFAIGSQFDIGHFNSVTLGIISAMQRDWGESLGWQVTFQVDAGANPGSSGGPIFNITGEVIGIVIGAPTQIFAGIVYIIPVNLVMQDIDEIYMMFVQGQYEFEVEGELTTEDLVYHISGVEGEWENCFESLLELVESLRDRIRTLEDYYSLPGPGLGR